MAAHAAAERNKAEIPFKVRFKAWWEGVEPDRLLRQGSGDPEQDKAEADSIHVDPEAAANAPRWTDERVSVCRRIWEIEENDEVVHPGGAAYSYDLFNPMALDNSKSALDLSSGLGGGTRRIALKDDIWMVGMEEDSELAGRANALSTQHGMATKAPIAAFDANDFELPERKFHGVLFRERLYRHANKRRTLMQIARALKNGGHLVLTDYVLAAPESVSEATIQAWRTRSDSDAAPWTRAELIEALEALGFEIRVDEDETDRFRQTVLDSWQRFVDSLAREDLTRGFVNNMMPEAQYWLLLVRSLESGALRYHHLHAIKRKKRAPQ